MKTGRQTSPRQLCGSRSGMTLIEILLVVAIMVVVAALAVPAVQQTFANQALKKGADRVRVAMGQARVKSIRYGEEYAVFLLPGGSYFSVAPFRTFQEQNSLASQRDKVAQQGSQSNYEDDLLPQGVIFVGTDVGADARAAEVLSSIAANGSLRTILFYPDGTSQDARVVIQNEKQATMEVQLRGLTGIAKTVRTEGNASQQ